VGGVGADQSCPTGGGTGLSSKWRNLRTFLLAGFKRLAQGDGG